MSEIRDLLVSFMLAVLGGERSRYENRHRILDRTARRLGFRLYNKNLAWPSDAEYRAAWRGFPEGSGYIHERKFNLFNIACALRDVPGDIAECGVYRAGSSHLMLTATQGTGKHLYGFDSFAGLSEPVEQDSVERRRTFSWKKHDMSVSEEVARDNLERHAGRFTLLKGWIPERFAEVADRRFSLVHLDVDLYEPTLASVSFFYPRLNQCGVIVCDDYGFESCPGARRAMDEFSASVDKRVIHLTTGQGLILRS